MGQLTTEVLWSNLFHPPSLVHGVANILVLWCLHLIVQVQFSIWGYHRQAR